MAAYKPHTPYNVPFFLQTPTVSIVKGIPYKTYTEAQTPRFCSFRTFGGTENTENDLYTVIDTATVETWFDPAITAACRIRVAPTDGSGTGKVYEILGTPENIEMRNQFAVFKVRAITGGA